MSNPLYEQYGQQIQYNNPLLERYLQFKNNFQGDPRQTVQNLLTTGQMSQYQFNILAQQATQLQKMLNL